MARWAAVGILLGVTCGAASTAARTSARDAEPIASLARTYTAVWVQLTITDDPRQLRRNSPGPPKYVIPATVNVIKTANGGITRGRVRILVFGTDHGWSRLLPSQRVAAEGTLAPARGVDLIAAVLTAPGEPTVVKRPSWMQLAAGRLRAGLQKACEPLPPEPGGLLPGLVIGDTSRLDPAVADDFRRTGMTHLVAVSGSNVAIIVAIVLFAARWCRAGPVVSATVCALALIGFVILVRPSPSVVRAAAMGAIGLLALAVGRGRSAAPALATAVLGGLLIDPALAVDAGFALSVLATAALVLVAPKWRDALRARGVPPGAAEALVVPAAAQVACAPLVAALSASVSLSAIPANLVAVPAIAPATVLGVGAAVLSPLWPDGAAGLAWLASWPARWLVAVAHVGADLPAGSVPWPGGIAGGLALAGVVTAVLVLARHRWLRRLMLVGVVGVAAGVLPVRLVAPGWPPPTAVVVACDVGQGDALVLPSARGEAVVVDAGPDPVLIDGCLRRLGVRAIPVLIVTHFHADHIGGISGVLRGRIVHAVGVPAYGEPAEGNRRVRDAVRGVPVTEVRPGWSYARGSLTMTALGPVRPLAGTRSDPNNNSLVLRAVNRGVSVFLAGDAEVEEQRDLLALDPAMLRSDVLKVAHHGSAYQDPLFISAVAAVLALVSVGADNRYGHPNEGLLDRLTRGGARVLRTDLSGDAAAVATTDGVGAAVTGAARPRAAPAGPRQRHDHLPQWIGRVPAEAASARHGSGRGCGCPRSAHTPATGTPAGVRRRVAFLHTTRSSVRARIGARRERHRTSRRHSQVHAR